jgi:hypothetical protein
MARKIFGECMEFFLKGLNPFKIQTKFNFVWLPAFLFKFCWEFELLSKKESYPFWIYPHPGKIWQVLKVRKPCFSIFQIKAVLIIWKKNIGVIAGPGPLKECGKLQ